MPCLLALCYSDKFYVQLLFCKHVSMAGFAITNHVVHYCEIIKLTATLDLYHGTWHCHIHCSKQINSRPEIHDCVFLMARFTDCFHLRLLLCEILALLPFATPSSVHFTHMFPASAIKAVRRHVLFEHDSTFPTMHWNAIPWCCWAAVCATWWDTTRGRS